MNERAQEARRSTAQLIRKQSEKRGTKRKRAKVRTVGCGPEEGIEHSVAGYSSPTGFISEHSAEYVLVPKACAALRARYRVVVPFFFWATREGGTLSHQIGPRSKVRIVSIFARRPKLLNPGDPRILVRFNEELFRRARASEPSGIPVYAGVPFVHSYEELGNDPICLWFRIAATLDPDSTNGTVDIEVDGSGECQTPLPSNLRQLQPGDLSDDVMESTAGLDWCDALDTLRSIRRAVNSGPWFFGGYSPFHVLLIEDRSALN